MLTGTKVCVKTVNGGEVVGTVGTYTNGTLTMDKVFGSYMVHTKTLTSDRIKKITVLN